MKGVLMFIMLASVGNGIKYDGLRVKFGWSEDLAGVENFFSLPRTIDEAKGEGWHRTDRPEGPMEDLPMYCPPGKIVCVLYGPTGFIAGLQVAFPVDSIDPDLKPERYFVRWSAPPAEGEPKDFWSATQWYLNEDTLKAGAGATEENGATLQNGGIWVKGVDGKRLKIPLSEPELAAMMFKKQNCVPKMGTHYYYNITRQFDCDDILLPWFGLFWNGELAGLGFQTIGKRPDAAQNREWFEKLPGNRRAPLMTMTRAPECMLDLHEKYGSLSLHIFFVDKPWEITCQKEDQ